MVKYGRSSMAARRAARARVASSMRKYVPKATLFGSVVAGRASRADPSCVTLLTLDPRNSQQAHILSFQAVAAAHVPGYNTWGALAVSVLTRQDLLNLLNNLLTGAVVQVTNFTGIKITATLNSMPLAVFYRSSPTTPHMVVSNVGRIKFVKRFVKDPVSGANLLPDRIILAAGDHVSYKIRFYYTLKPVRPLV